MRQEDYILREIQKIGLMLAGIFNKITGNKGDTAISVTNQFEEAKGMLLNDIGFDTDVFLSLTRTEIEKYILKFRGIRGVNIELLADILREMGMDKDSMRSDEYLEKALQLYELCNSTDKTFSQERESKIVTIRKLLNH
jgi:hypothetical protein